MGKKCVDSEVDCSGAECTQPGVKLCSTSDPDCRGLSCQTGWPAWSTEPSYFQCS